MGWLDRLWGSPQLLLSNWCVNTGILKRGSAKLGLGHRLVTRPSDEGRLKLEDMEFKVNLGYIVPSCQEERKKTVPGL